MKPTSSPQEQEQDRQIIELLKDLGARKVEYPQDLLAARRAAFFAQVEQKKKTAAKTERVARARFVKHLESLQSAKAEYPSELLAARRAAFIAQVEQYSQAEAEEELVAADQEVIRLLKKVKSLEPEYAPTALASRRSAYVRQIRRGGSISLLDALQSYIQGLFDYKLKIPVMPRIDWMRTSLVLASLLLAIFTGSVLGHQNQLLSPAPTQGQSSSPVAALATGTNAEVAKVICKPGYQPPLCLAKETQNNGNVSSQENGARPAVAKDTMPSKDGIYKAAYINDGLYGPGASWVSKSAYSWIKIDLGKATTINTVTFGRDRLGYTKDHNPGQFVIAVAMTDNVYADGNSSNDYVEYTQVYDSKASGFNGIVPGSTTVRVEFQPTMARYLKITFVNQGTAVDEVEAFMAQPPVAVEHPTRKPKEDDLPVIVFVPPQPTDTIVLALPSDTAIPPTDTRVPPTNTSIPPTDTPRPTRTPVPPTDTPIPPTNTPRPTNTPVPPTDTSVPPTDTRVPPTDTPNPPTDAPNPPSDTPAPIVAPTDTPILIAVP